MRITIFGATGGTGKQLVKQALAEGNGVVAFARNPSKLNITDKNLTLLKGELTDNALIENAVRGSDAVISVLGPRGGSRNKPLTQGMHNIIEAMKKQGVRRLIISSTLSAKDPNDLPEFRSKALVTFVRVTMHAAYEEIVSVADTVRASNLDWTIVRLTMLDNKPQNPEKSERATWAGEK